MSNPDITIPDEAWRAAKREAAVAIYRLVEPDTRAHELTDDEIGEIARAACLAMLRAWPGAFTQADGEPTWVSRPAIILPLPQENTND